MFHVLVGKFFVDADNNLTTEKKNAKRFNLPDADYVASQHEGAEITSA